MKLFDYMIPTWLNKNVNNIAAKGLATVLENAGLKQKPSQHRQY